MLTSITVRSFHCYERIKSSPFCSPCPVECEAYSSGVNRKENLLSLYVLCVFVYPACPVAPADGTGARGIFCGASGLLGVIHEICETCGLNIVVENR